MFVPRAIGYSATLLHAGSTALVSWQYFELPRVLFRGWLLPGTSEQQPAETRQHRACRYAASMTLPWRESRLES